MPCAKSPLVMHFKVSTDELTQTYNENEWKVEWNNFTHLFVAQQPKYPKCLSLTRYLNENGILVRKKCTCFFSITNFHLSYCTANGFSTDLEEHRICWQELKISRSRRHSCIFLSNCSSQKFHLLRCNPIFIRTLQFVLQQFLSNHLLEEALVHTEAHQISMWIHVSSVAMHISIWF